MIHWVRAGLLSACLATMVAASPAMAELHYVTRGKSARIIVFVDGLQSDPAKSFRWGDGVGSWPELMAGDLSAENKQLPLARYDTALLSFAGTASDRATVPQLATRGLADLRAKGVLDSYEAIVFVAHGAGGLVVKSMLVQSSIAGSASLTAKTKMVFLLSVPAEGRPAANFLAALTQNQNLAISFGTVDVAVFLQGLESLWSEYLSRRSSTRRLEVFCRSETEPSFGVKVAAGQYTTEGCDDNGQETGTDHNSIARPASRDAGVYRWVRAHLADYFQRFPPEPGKLKPPIAVASAEGTTTAVPALPKIAEPATVTAPLAIAPAAPAVVAAAAPPGDLSPADTSTVTAAPAQVPEPDIPSQLAPPSSALRPAARSRRVAPGTLNGPAVQPARTGDWTFALKGADCNLPSQLWVVTLRDRKITTGTWNTRLGKDGKFIVDTSSACATELVRGKVSGTLGLGWYLYADPCHAIYCRTRFKMTWRLPAEAAH